MKPEKVLLLGTAPDAFVHDTLKALKEQGCEVHLVVTESRAGNFKDACHTLHTIEGHVKWYKLGLLRMFLKTKPNRVVIAIGDHWFHSNVVKAVNLWRVFNPKPRVSCMNRDFEEQVSRPNPHSGLFMLLLIALIPGSIAALILYPSIAWIPIAALIVLELTLILFDHVRSYDLKRNPGSKFQMWSSGKLHSEKDPTYGWVNRPGFKSQYDLRIDGLNPDSYSWKLTHDSDGRRYTAADPSEHDGKPVISLYGCSITYGQSVSDHESYPWLLQERLKEYKINNYGVGAWSLYQIFMRMKATLERDQPKVVVLGFHQELEMRATNSFNHRLYWMTHMQNPAFVYRGGKGKKYKPRGYKHLPFSNQIRLIKVMEYLSNRFAVRGRGKPELMRQTSQYLLKQIRALCAKHGTKLVVACLDNSEHYYSFFVENGFSWCITGVTSREVDWILFPFDGHPKPKAHVVYADVISKALQSALANKRVTPNAEFLAGHIDTTQEVEQRFIYPLF